MKKAKEKKKRGRKFGVKNSQKFHRAVEGRELPLPYNEAREYVIKNIVPLGVNIRPKWHEYADAGKLPPNIPKHPQNVYKGEGWEGWPSWFGEEKYVEQRPSFYTTGSEFLYWCAINGINKKLIMKHTDMSVGTILNFWTKKRASKSTINHLSKALPDIYEEALKERIANKEKGLENISEVKLQNMVVESVLSKEDIAKYIKTPHIEKK